MHIFLKNQCRLGRSCCFLHPSATPAATEPTAKPKAKPKPKAKGGGAAPKGKAKAKAKAKGHAAAAVGEDTTAYLIDDNAEDYDYDNAEYAAEDYDYDQE